MWIKFGDIIKLNINIRVRLVLSTRYEGYSRYIGASLNWELLYRELSVLILKYLIIIKLYIGIYLHLARITKLSRLKLLNRCQLLLIIFLRFISGLFLDYVNATLPFLKFIFVKKVKYLWMANQRLESLLLIWEKSFV